MKQIIIIGTGKAAMLHYRAYCMFVARENIFFIDPYFKQSNDKIIVFPDVEEALEKIVLASTDEGDLILDPFNGSGTTGIAATKLNRKYIGIDNEKEFLDLTIRRKENIWK